MNALGKLFLMMAKDIGDEEQVVTLECLEEFADLREHLMKTYAIYLKPADTPDSNRAREKELYPQRSAFLALIRKFEAELSEFECKNPIPKEILEKIIKE